MRKSITVDGEKYIKEIKKIPLYNEEPDSLISVFNELAAKINVIIIEINKLKLENNEC